MGFWAAAAPYIASFAGAALSSLLAPRPNESASEAAARASDIQAQISLEQWENYKKNYLPLETSLIAEAQKAGSEEEIAAAEGRAGADVTGAFERANRASERRMQAFGINPASPSYSANLRSSGLAEGAAYAGARTTARERELERGYNRRRDIVSIGRGIPPVAASAASGAASSAALQQSMINSQFAQNQQNMQNIGYGIQPLIGMAANYFGNQSNVNNATNPNTQSQTQPTFMAADGGMVHRPKKIHMAVRGALTPHMNRYAKGGKVGMHGMEPSQANMMMRGPGTETSDSIPAVVDGQHPAALSTGEFVMSAEVPKLSGEEILQAINRAGLEKRDEKQMQQRRMNMAGLEEF